MNFDFTDDQQAIKKTAHEFLASRFKLDKVRRLAEAGEYDDGIWNEISELGWPGIFIPEELGGQGLGVVELVILAEELGYVAAPTPFLSNAAAGLAIQFGGSDEQKSRLLPGIASGESLGTVGIVADGSASLVPDAELTDFIVLFDNGGASVVETGSATIERVDTIDSTRQFSRVPGAGEPLEGDVQGALDRIAVRCRRSSSGSPSGRWRWPSSTPRTASSSAVRSAPTRPSRTTARRCCSRPRARAR